MGGSSTSSRQGLPHWGLRLRSEFQVFKIEVVVVSSSAWPNRPARWPMQAAAACRLPKRRIRGLIEVWKGFRQAHADGRVRNARNSALAALHQGEDTMLLQELFFFSYAHVGGTCRSPRRPDRAAARQTREAISRYRARSQVRPRRGG